MLNVQISFCTFFIHKSYQENAWNDNKRIRRMCGIKRIKSKRLTKSNVFGDNAKLTKRRLRIRPMAFSTLGECAELNSVPQEKTPNANKHIKREQGWTKN